MSNNNTPPSTSKKSKTRSQTLFIVESPNKVKTIEKYLSDDFIVRATVGHIADIPSQKSGVDVHNNFAPRYELTEKGAEVIAGLKRDLKRCSQVVLATDDDREGEVIAAHVLQFLAPTVPVIRIVFHAVTKSAIEEALLHPRDIDENLVEAARTRRILDRLFGFEVTDVSRQKVRSNTTAGRVQSPALRLVVEREYERMNFVSAEYADVMATSDTSPSFTATMKSMSGKTLATGKDFDANGSCTKNVQILEMNTAQSIADALVHGSTQLVVSDVSEREATQNPRPPFTMSSLLQEAINRLGMNMKEAQTVSQLLFERGLITYPRSDNPVHDLSSRHAIRNTIAQLFGDEMVAPFHRYTTSKKNIQGAHEAIRPTYLDNQTPVGLTGRQMALYRLIWQRTIASQMIEAKGKTVTVTMHTDGGDIDAVFTAAGTTYSQLGFRSVYTPVGNDEKSGAPFPELKHGDIVQVSSAVAQLHQTMPPPRFTEASLVKELENLGIGRPSTYGHIIAKLRSMYVWSKQGDKALIPTVTAFAIHRLLTTGFSNLIDYGFTNQLENALDQIATDKTLRDPFLKLFYFGDSDHQGLEDLVLDAVKNIDAKSMFALSLGAHPKSGDEVIVHAGKMFTKKTFSPYIKCGAVTKAIPDQTEFSGLSQEQILALFESTAPRLLGKIDGVPLYVKTRGNSSYFQLGEKGNLPHGAKKPKVVGLLKSMSPDSVSIEDAMRMLTLPRVVGSSRDGLEITATFGKFGGYIVCGDETRPLKNDELIFTLTENEAQALLDIPKVQRKGKRKKK